MTYKEFRREITNAYAEVFPRSLCDVGIFKALGRSIFIDCYLAKDKHELPNMLFQNDMFRIRFWIDMPDDFMEESELPDNLTLEVCSKFYCIKPKNKYLYCDYRSLRFQKTKGNPEKIVKTLEKYFQKLKMSVKEDLTIGNIHPNYLSLAKEKIYD